MSEADENVPNLIQMTTPRSSLGSGATISSSISSSSSSSSSQSRQCVKECLDAWSNYLHVINALCSAGYKLAQTISQLEHWGKVHHYLTCFLTRQSNFIRQLQRKQPHSGQLYQCLGRSSKS